MEEIKGVPNEKLDRLWRHLLKIEKMTGMPLIEKPRFTFLDCPIENFSPNINKDGRLVRFVSSRGRVYYLIASKSYISVYKIYTYIDALWWSSLGDKTRRQITKWVIQKIKERNENSLGVSL